MFWRCSCWDFEDLIEVCRHDCCERTFWSGQLPYSNKVTCIQLFNMIQEAVLCATASIAGSGSIFLHDIRTGSPLASFKHSNASFHSTAFVETNNAQGGFMLAAQPDKSILNVYNFQKVFIHPENVFTRYLNSITGSDHTEDSIARKTFMHRC